MCSILEAWLYIICSKGVGSRPVSTMKCKLEEYFIYELHNRVFSIPDMCLIIKLSLSSMFLRIVHWRVATSESNKLLLLSLCSPDAAGQ